MFLHESYFVLENDICVYRNFEAINFSGKTRSSRFVTNPKVLSFDWHCLRLDRGRKEFEHMGIDNDEKINNLEKAVIEAMTISNEADKKYDEEARRYAIMEMTLEAVEDKADDCET